MRPSPKTGAMDRQVGFPRVALRFVITPNPANYDFQLFNIHGVVVTNTSSVRVRTQHTSFSIKEHYGLENNLHTTIVPFSMFLRLTYRVHN